MFRRLIAVIACAVAFASAASAQGQTPQERYVSKYSSIAVSEMYRSGVPASITLAQGILESRSGLSVLAINGNNHFGIKCHKSWKGATLTADDDRPNECFRSYPSADDSFHDHSDFLRYSDRYKFLFDLDLRDYKGWAYGLSQAGYATDPEYPSKLIRIIETYGLYEYDTQAVEVVTGEPVPEIPESPLSIESPRIFKDATEQFRFPLDRRMYTKNGVPFIYAAEGETYASIAKRYNLFRREILRFNDLKESEPLSTGDIVYLQRKRKAAAPGLEKYIVGEDGESLRGICQRFAIRESALRKLNALPKDYVPSEGDELLLRPVSKKSGK